MGFIRDYPSVRLDLLSFSFCNALGQVFIFLILEECGSLILVTVTITRKLMTMLLSIILYKHNMYWWQWVGMLSVFGGVSVGILAKRGGKKAKSH